MLATFWNIIRHGSMTWFEDNNLILYPEFFIVIITLILGLVYITSEIKKDTTIEKKDKYINID